MLISAKYDEYVDINDTENIWNSKERQKRYVYNCDHAEISLKRNKIATDTSNFIQDRIKIWVEEQLYRI